MSHLFVRSATWLVALALLLASGAVVAAETKSAAEDAKAKAHLVGVVNVNTATNEELGLLPGVDSVRALAIIERRKEMGGFKSIEDLKQISGIGERALERIRPHVALQGKTTAKMVR